MTKGYLHPNVVLNYIVSGDPSIDRIIIEGNPQLFLSDFALYEAIGSVPVNTTIKMQNLLKLLEHSELIEHGVTHQLTTERKNKLRVDAGVL